MSMSMIRAQFLSVWLASVLLVAALAPHWLLWGPPTESSVSIGVPFLAALLIGIVVHEGLHGIGFIWGGADWSEVEFGFNLSGLAPYAHCKVPLRCGPYRWACALPGVVLGGLPLVAGLVLGNWDISFFAAVMLVLASGDALMLWMLRKVPRRAWVRDHPTQMGGLLLGRPSSDTAPELAFDLDE